MHQIHSTTYCYLVAVILSDRRESKDLGTNFTANVDKLRRSLDSVSLRSG